MSKLKIGWSEIDITPDKKASLAGQYAERISEYVEKPLTATAMAISTENDQMVLCSVDMVSVSFNLIAAVREKLLDNRLGLDPQKVIYTAIHTHTGPEYPRFMLKSKYPEGCLSNRALMESLLPAGKKYVENANISANPDIITNDEMFTLLVDRLSKVVLDAWSAREDGSYANAFGRAVVGLCRRAVYSDGSAQMWGDTNTAVFEELESGNDSGIELMYVYNSANELTGIIANLACPAQCVQHRLFISPDFWGETKKLLREHFGTNIFLLALCAPAGDQCPVDLVRWVEPESDVHDPNLTRINPPYRKADPSMFDLAGMRKVGKRVAREIIDVYEEGIDEPQSEVALSHNVHVMQLPIRRVTMSEYKAAQKAVAEYMQAKQGDVDFNDAAHLTEALGILQRYALQEKMNVLDTEVHVARLGNLAFASFPFELFLNYGNQIRACSLAEQTFLIQQANGAEGYLPTKKAEEGGHYSGFVGSGQVGHVGGEQLVRETLRDIFSLFSA